MYRRDGVTKLPHWWRPGGRHFRNNPERVANFRPHTPPNIRFIDSPGSLISDPDSPGKYGSTT